MYDTAEEAYLRLDIPCGSPDCVACPPTSPALAPSPQHLLLPDASVLAGCLEVFELPEVENLVLLTSVVRQVGWGWRRGQMLLVQDRQPHGLGRCSIHAPLDESCPRPRLWRCPASQCPFSLLAPLPHLQLHDGGNMRRAARLRALYSDPRRRNVLFDNLHHRETAPASLREQRAGLALLAAAEWCALQGWGVGGAGAGPGCVGLVKPGAPDLLP